MRTVILSEAKNPSYLFRNRAKRETLRADCAVRITAHGFFKKLFGFHRPLRTLRSILKMKRRSHAQLKDQPPAQSGARRNNRRPNLEVGSSITSECSRRKQQT